MPTKIRSLAALALSAGAVAGCASFGSLFPSHEDVFTPIGPTVGVARIDGKDTSWVLSGAGYELTSSNRALLPSVQTALDGAAADFRAYFAGDPPTKSVVALQLKRGQRPDTARARADPATRRDSALRPPRRAGSRNERRDDVGSPTGLGRSGRARLGERDDERPPTARRPTGTTSSAGVPQWLEVAIPSLIGGWSDADIVSAQIGLHPDRIIGLRSIFSGHRPANDTTRGTARRGDDGSDGIGGTRSAIAATRRLSAGTPQPEGHSRAERRRALGR